MSIDKLGGSEKDVGGIPVARILPNRNKRTIGAWCFLDHAGPSIFKGDSRGLQVGLHPHTNLQTFTWMIEGEVLHQDSLGNRQTIRPGAINLMTAGNGKNAISHTEQTVAGCDRLHAVQLWIALPRNRDIAPAFEHQENLPTWEDDRARYLLTIGDYAGHRAPTTCHTPLIGLDIFSKQSGNLTLKLNQNHEYGLLVIEGNITHNGETYRDNELIALSDCQLETDTLFTFHSEKNTRLFLIGGLPLPFTPVLWWNFVGQSGAEISQAVKDWNNHHPRFGNIDITGTGLKRLNAPEPPAPIHHDRT